MSRRRVSRWVVGLFLLMLVNAIPLSAEVITPGRGGDNVGSPIAEMIMPKIKIIDNNVVVYKQDGINLWASPTGAENPIMRPLSLGHDLSNINLNLYNALNGTAWNWQYGWSNAMFSQGSIPADCNIFIQVTAQDAGLSTYDRTANIYAPIFETIGSVWMWNDDISMSHNAYTVTPQYGNWSATYNLYVGYKSTKLPVPGWGAHIGNADLVLDT